MRVPIPPRRRTRRPMVQARAREARRHDRRTKTGTRAGDRSSQCGRARAGVAGTARGVGEGRARRSASRPSRGARTTRRRLGASGHRRASNTVAAARADAAPSRPRPRARAGTHRSSHARAPSAGPRRVARSGLRGLGRVGGLCGAVVGVARARLGVSSPALRNVVHVFLGLLGEGWLLRRRPCRPCRRTHPSDGHVRAFPVASTPKPRCHLCSSTVRRRSAG